MNNAVEKDMGMGNDVASMMDRMDKIMDRMDNMTHKMDRMTDRMDKVENVFEKMTDEFTGGATEEAMGGDTYNKGLQEKVVKAHAMSMMIHGISTSGAPADYSDGQDETDETDETESLDDPHDMITPPLCYICSCWLYLTEPNPRLTPGVYTGRRKLTDIHFWRDNAWPRYFRMSKQFPIDRSLDFFLRIFIVLLHPRRNLCKLSGTSFFASRDRGRRTLRAPWNEDMGIVGSAEVEDKLLARAFVQDTPEDPPGERRTGFIVHTRCWDLLRTHKVWSLSRGDLRVILDALRRKSARDWKKPPPGEEPFSENSWPMLSDFGDPFASKLVESLIRQARRMTQKRFKVIRHKQRIRTWLNRIPPEVLSTIANMLPAPDVSAAQKAIGSYLGDVFWRSRIPTEHFHEIRPVLDETLDWEFLCSELERLETYFEEDLEKHRWVSTDKLVGRRWALKQLDEIAAFIPSGDD